jgi:hypothetical protein
MYWSRCSRHSKGLDASLLRSVLLLRRDLREFRELLRKGTMVREVPPIVFPGVSYIISTQLASPKAVPGRRWPALGVYVLWCNKSGTGIQAAEQCYCG